MIYRSHYTFDYEAEDSNVIAVGFLCYPMRSFYHEDHIPHQHKLYLQRYDFLMAPNTDSFYYETYNAIKIEYEFYDIYDAMKIEYKFNE